MKIRVVNNYIYSVLTFSTLLQQDSRISRIILFIYIYIYIYIYTYICISSLCDYSDGCIMVKEAVANTVSGADAAARQAWEQKKQVTFKDRTLFTNGMSEINNKQGDI